MHHRYVQTRDASQHLRADVQSDAVRLLALGASLITVGLVWAAVVAALPTATKLLLTAAVLVILGGTLGTSGASAGNKRLVFASAAMFAFALTLAGFLVGAYEEFVR
jgi:hypothetical protein